MKNYRFILVYLIMVVVQVLLDNYFPLSRYVLISVLPALTRKDICCFRKAAAP